MRLSERTLAPAGGIFLVAALLGASVFTADGQSGQDSTAEPMPTAVSSSRLLEASTHESDQPNEDSITVDVDLGHWLETTLPDGSLVVEQFPLPGGVQVSLELERFEVTRADTRYVLGRIGGGDVELAYNPSRLALYRGRVRGLSDSHVFIGFGGGSAFGFIDVGGGIQRYQVSAVANAQVPPGRTSLSVFQSDSVVSLPPGVALCGVDTSGLVAAEPAPLGAHLGTLPPTPRVIELAIETDFELFELFNDVDAVADYVTLLYAAVSDIFLRDVNARIVLTFVRVWDTADDLFNEESPLGPFRDYWEQNMGGVHRDAAQFFSGRRDMPYGGSAWVGSLCGSFGYSVVGYALGYFPNPDVPSAFHYDIHVTAHELGHNFAAFHSHDYGIDTCNDLFGPTERGTIMSYCSQTRNGGNANTDQRIHAIIKDVIQEYFNEIDCLFHDCNDNGVPDDQDISGGDSADVNGNGVPDECEDCNGNGVIDTIDISSGFSADLNGNDIPDECEADCNSNDIPDDLDISLGNSADVNGNDIPDECEPDCNENGVPDYNEIQADMTLDVDRNLVLDSCQDCDDDGINDLDALGGAHNVWIANHDPGGAAKEYHAVSGAFVKASESGVIINGDDLIISADGRIFVTSSADDRVVQLDAAGEYVGDFVEAGAGGLNHPAAMTFGPGGKLFVVSRDNHSVLRYDGLTGVFLGAFVSSGAGGLSFPVGLAFGPDGNLYVSSDSASDTILRYDGTTGQFIDIFVEAADNGGLNNPRGLLFKPDGNLLVASFLTKQVLEYDGQTGAFVRQFNNGGTQTALTLDGPWALRLGRSGNVFVSRYAIAGGEAGGDGFGQRILDLHLNTTRIFEFDVETGIFLRSYVMGHDTDLWTPTGFDFMPGFDADCNFNLIPDTCDIADGTSLDRNGNGIPDECETVTGDIDGDGSVGANDLLILLANWGPCDDCNDCPPDLNGDCSVGAADLLILLANWG
ncbi:MAG: M12 family metallo-peptidase [Phycisphaerales bacterium]